MNDTSALIATIAMLSIFVLNFGFEDAFSRAAPASVELTEGHARDSAPSLTPYALAAVKRRVSVTPGQQASKPRTSAKRFVVYFGFDSATVSERAQQAIRLAHAHARRIKAKYVRLSGHADSAGATGYNARLNSQRASAVASAFGSIERPTGDGTLEIRGFGESYLAVPTPDGTVEARNRRVEIVIMG